MVGGSVKELFTPFHIVIETSSFDDLTEENITKQVIIPSYFFFKPMPL